MKVMFAENADSRISGMISGGNRTGDMVVVSSDRRHVISSARSSRVNHMSSEDFWKLISKRKKTSTGRKPDPGRNSETTAWYEEILRKEGKL